MNEVGAGALRELRGERAEQVCRAQPRPALGRRPWFAFLRRARSLRRFAFAMAGRLPPLAAQRARAPFPGPHREVRLRAGTWHSAPLLLADSTWTRLRGLKAVPCGWGLLLRTRSVHSFGFRRRVLVVVIGDGGRLLGLRTMLPRRLVAVDRARWMAELPIGSDLPRPGTMLQLEVRHRAGETNS